MYCVTLANNQLEYLASYTTISSNRSIVAYNCKNQHSMKSTSIYEGNITMAIDWKYVSQCKVARKYVFLRKVIILKNH